MEQDGPEATTPASSSSCLPAGLVTSAESGILPGDNVEPSKPEQFHGALSNWRRLFQQAVKLGGARSAASMHCDRGNKLSCKKAVSRGSLTDAECILRLKRWLIAGCSDSNWPVHRQRAHHVDLGALEAKLYKISGMSEAEMDALVASWSSA